MTTPESSSQANADVQFPISPAPSALGSPKNDCVGPLSDDQEDDLKDGLFYINIHTSKIVDLIQVGFPGGEIRGQVLPIGGSNDDDSRQFVVPHCHEPVHLDSPCEGRAGV